MPLAKHALREPVAFGAGGERSTAELMRDAAWVAGQLPAATPGSHVLVAVGQDRYAFAAALLGTWLRGHAAALPPHTGRDAILRLAQRAETVAVLHDTTTQAPLRVDALLATTPGDQASPAQPLVLPELLATLYTEDMRAWPQRRPQLLGEAQLLIDTFGLGPGLRFVSTLAPCNAYGLMLGVVVPLLSGGAFSREVTRVVAAGRGEVLVSAPAHLRDAAPGMLAGFGKVFSSRAPLTAAVASREIIDLFGATQSGSVGYRLLPDEEAFRPLAGVTVAVGADGALKGAGAFGEFALEDPAELGADGRFTLVERVGVASEALLERRLAAISGVREVAVVGVRGELLAAVVAPGWDEAGLMARLRAEGSGTSAAMPSRIVCVERLLRDDTGRYSRARLLMLFARAADGTPLNFELEWRGEEVSHEAGREQRVYRAHVPADYGYFVGHFPGYPILPGAAQLSDLVLPCVRRARPELGPLALMTRVKFLDRVRPDQDVEVVLSWREPEPSVEFALRRADTLCATGKLSFAAVPP